MADVIIEGDVRLLLEKVEDLAPKIKTLETLIGEIKGYVDAAVASNELGWLNEAAGDWTTKGTTLFENGKEKMNSLSEQISVTIPALKKITGAE